MQTKKKKAPRAIVPPLPPARVVDRGLIALAQDHLDLTRRRHEDTVRLLGAVLLERDSERRERCFSDLIEELANMKADIRMATGFLRDINPREPRY